MKVIKTNPKTHELAGKYTLILYYGDNPDGTGRAAFMDREDDNYNLEPYAPEFFFEKIKGLEGISALKKAEEFVSDHPSARGSSVAKIMNDNEISLGFEVRPLYDPIRFGTTDILDINYHSDGLKVLINVKLTDLMDMGTD